MSSPTSTSTWKTTLRNSLNLLKLMVMLWQLKLPNPSTVAQTTSRLSQLIWPLSKIAISRPSSSKLPPSRTLSSSKRKTLTVPWRSNSSQFSMPSEMSTSRSNQPNTESRIIQERSKSISLKRRLGTTNTNIKPELSLNVKKIEMEMLRKPLLPSLRSSLNLQSKIYQHFLVIPMTSSLNNLKRPKTLFKSGPMPKSQNQRSQLTSQYQLTQVIYLNQSQKKLKMVIWLLKE